MTHTKPLLLLIICLLLGSNAFGQNAKMNKIDWPNHPERTYVYQISNKQAEKILVKKHNIHSLKAVIGNPITSFNTIWENAPSQGHFVFVDVNDLGVTYSYAPAIPFQVFLFKEYGILSVQIIDSSGNIRRDAKVKIKKGWDLFNPRINFDKETQTYRIDDWSEKRNRILTVDLDGFRSIFDLEKHFVGNYDNYYGGSNNSPSFYSYMLTDKNKYKPHEKVRFKSYALSGRKRPLKKDLDVLLNGKKIKEISPYNPGGFSGEVELHDSLKLVLDKNYSIQLREKSGRIVSATTFRYEDYELYDNNMLTQLSSVQYSPDTNKLQIKVTDANGLFLQDVNAKVTIHRKDIKGIYSQVESIPNVLLNTTIKLDNDRPTSVDILPEWFGKTDCNYTVSIVVTTYDNQVMSNHKHATFFYKHHKIETSSIKDSLYFRFYSLGIEKEVQAELRYNNNKDFKLIKLPYKEVFNQSIKNYTIKVPELNYEENIYGADIDTKLAVQGGVIKDSFNIQLINPLKLDVSWYVYQGSDLLQKGSGKQFNFKSQGIDMNTACYVEMFYYVGGTEQSFKKHFIPKEDNLDIKVDLPTKIYPGQTVDATIKIKDNLGKPVSNVDITAFATNSLLKYNVPNLPYYGKSPKTRESRSWYSFSKREFLFSESLDYNHWNKIARLDTITYYNFIFPKNKMFKYTVNTPENTTEFAPYVMKEGEPAIIYVTTLNDYYVDYSWTEQPKEYSFLVNDTLLGKYNTLVLRLSDKAIILDSILFEPHKKTIFSIDVDNLPKKTRVINFYPNRGARYYTFSDYEKSSISRYIAEFPVSGTDYLYQGNKPYLINSLHLSGSSRKVLAGPIPQNKSRYNNGVTYKHEGGFSYEYDDNVVYKYPKVVYPEYLSSYNNGKRDKLLNTLNDFYLTPDRIEKRENQKKYENNHRQKWFYNRYIKHNMIEFDIYKISAAFVLPTNVGVLDLLLIKSSTNEVNYLYDITSEKDTLKSGDYNIVVLFNNGDYLKYDSLTLKYNYKTVLDMRESQLHKRDEKSSKWLEESLVEVLHKENNQINIKTRPIKKGLYYSDLDQSFYKDYFRNYDDDYYYFRPRRKAQSYSLGGNSTFKVVDRKGRNVSGVIKDIQGEELIGVIVNEAGTLNGVASDIDGKFSINIKEKTTLVFSYIGFNELRATVYPGDVLEVTMGENSNMLEEVVIVGYGVTKKNSLTASMTTTSMTTVRREIIGEKEAAQEDIEEDDDAEVEDAQDKLYQELLLINGLRSNFSDVGFWEPSLVTNRKGEASFKTKFPDNITKWDAVIYAMNRRLKTGTYRQSIKSYKPIMAELRNPRFMVEGDTSYFAGNIRNYSKDAEISGNVMFAYNKDTTMNTAISLQNSHQDKMLVYANSLDSITAQYIFTRNDGYNDGEQRSIPVIKQGTEIARGVLGFLPKDEKLAFKADNNEEVHIEITGKQLDVYMNAAEYLIGYKYACNEQLASRLVGLLASKMYVQYMGGKFSYDKEINKIIKRLIENRNDKQLWSWWGRSTSTSYWMSAHIMRSLKMAKDAGYTVDVNFTAELDYSDIAKRYKQVSISDIDVLHALSDLEMDQNYGEAVKIFEKEIRRLEYKEDTTAISYAKKSQFYSKRSYLKQKMQLWEISLKNGLPYSSDSITKYFEKDVLGAISCTDNLSYYYWYNDKLVTTLMAYRIVRADSTLRHFMEPMQLYILGTKNHGWNTYYSSNIISTIMPDLLNESVNARNPVKVELRGKKNETLTVPYYSTILKENEELSIEKKEGIPLIYQAYTIKRVTEEQQGEAFTVNTRFLGGDYLTAGIPVELELEVTVNQDNAEHVQIEVPIPAGCSYQHKNGRGSYEVHREHFKEGVSIFCEKLPKGTYRYSIMLLPRYTGKYSLNPAKVELMYFPIINSNTGLRKIDIVERNE